MAINWFFIGVIVLNLLFSTIVDVFAKFWGITNNQNWLYAGLAVNLLTTFFFMYSIRLGGLAVTTSIMLLITMAINVTFGFYFFQESIHPTQWLGIVIGFLAVVLISGLFVPTR